MSEHTAYPVFHDVEPTEVRKQSGPVRKAFAKNTKKEADQKWRDAMKEPSNLAGDESKLIQIIVDNIFKKLRSISSSIDGKLVGMEMRIDEVLISLKICTEDVRVIGIKGWEMMRSRKVLVVLDDVDHIDQLEALAVSLIRNVNLLSDKEALCLFSRYTFGREIPIQGYEQLSGQSVRYVVGLPLTIRVLGSSSKLISIGGILEVAKDLYHLECLEELTVLNTEITHVPYSVCRLKQLKSLKLQDCQHLEELTEYFGQLKSLEELSLANIKIKHLPFGSISVVSSVRKVIDDVYLPRGSVKTRWIKEVPLKINIHAWKVTNDYLPTRFNLSRRGIDIESIVCPMCNSMVESSRHLFFSCEFSNQIMCKIMRWWELDYREINSYEAWGEWMLSIRFPSKLKKVFEGTCYIVWWFIWIWRNQLLFGQNSRSKSLMFDDIVSRSFYWIRSRCKAKFSWID
ncbi:RNA-directed DNA polymerase, eukaryota [Tanacetum coccineum]|uniref:RNA-directed DNA polymerase, eukaryota n=1 Tax=Tanacetum coccineum TaxID=301880 RepID=A0ABQ5FJX8_9ASTR